MYKQLCFLFQIQKYSSYKPRERVGDYITKQNVYVSAKQRIEYRILMKTTFVFLE